MVAASVDGFLLVADPDISKELDVFVGTDRGKVLLDALHSLMVRGDAISNEPVRVGISIK